MATILEDTITRSDRSTERALEAELQAAAHEPIAEHRGRDLRSVKPVVRVLYHRFRHRPFEDRLELWRAADRVAARRSQQRRPDLEERQRRGLEAGEAYIKKHGALHGPERYDRWRRSGDAPTGLPSSGAIRKSFGSWPAFRARLEGRPEFDHDALALAGLGGFFAPRELLAMIRACALHYGYKGVSFEAAYRPYALDQLDLPLDQRDCRRFAISRGPFHAHFDGWAPARAEATKDLDLPDRPSSRESAAGSKQRAGCPVRLADTEYGDSAFIEALQDSAASCAPKRLTEHRHNAHRRKLVAQAAQRGEALPTLSAASVRQRFGSFPDGLFAAGLITEEERRILLRAGGRQMSDDEVRDSLRLVAEDEGPHVGRTAYRRCRHRLLAESEDDQFVLASDITVADRLGDGDFELAVQRVLRPDETHGQARDVETAAGGDEAAGVDEALLFGRGSS